MDHGKPAIQINGISLDLREHTYELQRLAEKGLSYCKEAVKSIGKPDCLIPPQCAAIGKILSIDKSGSIQSVPIFDLGSGESSVFLSGFLGQRGKMVIDGYQSIRTESNMDYLSCLKVTHDDDSVFLGIRSGFKAESLSQRLKTVLPKSEHLDQSLSILDRYSIFLKGVENTQDLVSLWRDCSTLKLPVSDATSVLMKKLKDIHNSIDSSSTHKETIKEAMQRVEEADIFGRALEDSSSVNSSLITQMPINYNEAFNHFTCAEQALLTFLLHNRDQLLDNQKERDIIIMVHATFTPCHYCMMTLNHVVKNDLKDFNVRVFVSSDFHYTRPPRMYPYHKTYSYPAFLDSRFPSYFNGDLFRGGFDFSKHEKIPVFLMKDAYDKLLYSTNWSASEESQKSGEGKTKKKRQAENYQLTYTDTMAV